MVSRHASEASAPGGASPGGERRREARRDPAAGWGRLPHAGARRARRSFARRGGAARPGATTGFTLIELLIVLSIIALLAGLAAPAVGSVTGANARKSANQLAGAMRFLYDTAALRHATCRMALDLDGRAWWAECSPADRAIARRPEDDEELARRLSGEKNAELRRLLAKTEFGSFKDPLADRRELPGRAAFGKVHVEGRHDTETGTVYVHFFPGGQAQRAFVQVVDGSNKYTVVVEPYTGRTRVVPGDVEVRD